MAKQDRRKGIITRERIYFEALNLYAEKGAQNVPFQAIADRIGITQAALYKYVSNRDQLLVESILFAAQKGREVFHLNELFNSKRSDEEKVLEYIRRNLNWIINDTPYNIAFPALHFYATQVAGLKKVHAEIEKRRSDVMKVLLKPLVPSADLMNLVYTFHHLLLGEMIEAYNGTHEESIENKIKRIAPLLRTWWQEK